MRNLDWDYTIPDYFSYRINFHSGDGKIRGCFTLQITMVSFLFSVAANVLKQEKLELEGYHLNLKPKHAGLVPSSERKVCQPK